MFVGAAGFAVAFIANYPSGLITFQDNVRTVHDICILSSWLVFVQRTGTAHFAIGITVMLLHVINVSNLFSYISLKALTFCPSSSIHMQPIIAAFRCKPTGNKWVERVFHLTITLSLTQTHTHPHTRTISIVGGSSIYSMVLPLVL